MNMVYWNINRQTAESKSDIILYYSLKGGNRMSVLDSFVGYYTAVVRILLPVIAIWLLVSCCRRLFCGKTDRPPLAMLVGEDGRRYPVLSPECAVGRGRLCDVCIPVPTVSRRHAVLTLDRRGWRVSDIRSKGGVFVEGERMTKPVELAFGHVLQLADVSFRFVHPTKEDIAAHTVTGKTTKSRNLSYIFPLFLLTLFQAFAGLSLSLHYLSVSALPLSIPLCFLGLIAAEWIYFALRQLRGIGIEILAFFMVTIGLCVAGSSVPASLFKQFAAAMLGLAMFWVLSFLLEDINRTMKLRYVIGALAVLLLAVNLLIGESRGGAKNWINFGFITVQPSEFVKIAFVFAGCATLERLMTARNTILFILFSGACIGPLFLMRDFGTAAIFFAGMLVISYMRSGDWKALVFLCAAAAVGSVLIIMLKPYVAGRFAVYRHAWEFASTTGYQQTRTMIAIGSGGLFGLGAGKGNLDRVAAADTDLVFGFVSEEWGLLIALCCAACLIVFALYAVRCAACARSAYYASAACATAGMFLFQAALNIFGSTDLLPLTGVTFPLISNGGSSMAASFAMLAFIQAAGRCEEVTA